MTALQQREQTFKKTPHKARLTALCGVFLALRQYRTKSVWRLCTPSACKFPVIFHKNAREYIKYSLRFLFHLTKNLTTHLSHNLCAVLPKTKSAVSFAVDLLCHAERCPRFRPANVECRMSDDLCHFRCGNAVLFGGFQMIPERVVCQSHGD